MKPLRKKIKDMVSQPLFAGIAIFVLVAGFVFALNRITGTSLSDFVIEMNGMLMDILIFAVVIVWLYKRQEKDNRLRNYREQLEDFRYWQSEEGVHRKVGILGRLKKMGSDYPSLRRFELRNAYLKDWDFKKADLSMANLEGAFLLDANLEEANLEEADMEKAYLQNAALKKANLKNAYMGWVDCRDADLTQTQLLCANLENAVLWQADLHGTDCEGAFLDGTDLTNANLQDAKFLGVDFGRAIMRNADLEGADLRGANLSQVSSLTEDQLKTASIDAQTQLPPDLFSRQEDLVAKSAAKGLPEPKSSFPTTRPPYRQKARKKIWTQTLEPGAGK